jgi:hypothetical protein
MRVYSPSPKDENLPLKESDNKENAIKNNRRQGIREIKDS